MDTNLSVRNYEDLVREGIVAAKNNQRALARKLLQQALRINPVDARAWMWLSATTDDIDERREYLERAVAADPGSVAARKGLALLTGKLDPGRLVPQGEGFKPQRPEEPPLIKVDAFSCPQCGGRVVFDSQQQDLVCEYCEYSVGMSDRPQEEPAGTPVDFVLPTREGHFWTQAQHHVACGQCGAVSLLDPGEKSTRCPYCGADQLVESEITAELIDPHSIGVFEMDERAAEERVRAWLAEGKLAPDDLASKAGTLRLRSAYYPFWGFSGTLEIRWRCEVNEGSGDQSRWVPRSGSDFRMFDDVMVPGLKALPERVLAQIEPFDIRKVVVFQPEHLTGWRALMYDRSMADASLIARQKVVKGGGGELHPQIEAGREYRDLVLGAGNWSGLTFKHVLLPLWVGSYQYKGEAYRFLVNGQTGKVAGQKPRDQAKVAMVWAGAAGVAVILILIIVLLLAAYGDTLLDGLLNLVSP